MLLPALFCVPALALGFAAASAQTAAPSPGPPALTVHITGSQYKPANATVHTGDTVVFVNDDPVAHNVMGDVLQSPDIAPGKSWSYTFDKTGTYNFTCSYHAWMKGTIVVSAPKT